MRFLLITILVNLVVATNAQEDSTDSNIIINAVERMPSYFGGDIQLIKDINTLTIYSDEAKKQKIEGRVYVSFYVEADGALSKISILRGLHHTLDSIAISAVQNINQKWIPGTQRSIPVKIEYRLPITFSLDNTLVNDKISAYWKTIGKWHLKHCLERKQIFSDEDFNCWYNFITSNYNKRKINEINLDLMFQNFNCNDM